MNPLPPLPRTPATPLHGLALLQLPRQSWPESHQDQAQTLEGAGPGCPFPKKTSFGHFGGFFGDFSLQLEQSHMKIVESDCNGRFGAFSVS